MQEEVVVPCPGTQGVQVLYDAGLRERQRSVSEVAQVQNEQVKPAQYVLEVMDVLAVLREVLQLSLEVASEEGPAAQHESEVQVQYGMVKMAQDVQEGLVQMVGEELEQMVLEALWKEVQGVWVHLLSVVVV